MLWPAAGATTDTEPAALEREAPDGADTLRLRPALNERSLPASVALKLMAPTDESDRAPPAVADVVPLELRYNAPPLETLASKPEPVLAFSCWAALNTRSRPTERVASRVVLSTASRPEETTTSALVPEVRVAVRPDAMITSLPLLDVKLMLPAAVSARLRPTESAVSRVLLSETSKPELMLRPAPTARLALSTTETA